MTSHISRNPRGRYTLLRISICLLVVALSVRLANINVKVPDISGLRYPGAKGNDSATVTQVVANSTLGFEKIIYINLPWRYDKEDSMVLQAAVSGIDITKYPGVPVDDMLEKGLGPTSNKDLLMPTEKACFRSHMNAWRDIIQNNWQSVLIMEADAGWDTDVREIMPHFAAGLEKLMHQRGLAPDSAKSTSDDPYLMDYWDVLQLGMRETDGDVENYNDTVVYHDPYTMVTDRERYGIELKANERIIRYGSFSWSTSTYAVTRRGAMKLLQRSALDMDHSVDNVMCSLAERPGFHSFISFPPIFVQTTYQEGLGMAHRNSDREPGDDSGDDYDEAWDFAREKMSPWAFQGYYDWVKFKKFALWDLQNYLYGQEP